MKNKKTWEFVSDALTFNIAEPTRTDLFGLSLPKLLNQTDLLITQYIWVFIKENFFKRYFLAEIPCIWSHNFVFFSSNIRSEE